MVAVIAVGFSVSEDCVNQISAPEHLQGLKSFYFFIGRFYAFPFACCVIVQHHGVDAQFDKLRFFNLKAPQKQVMKNFSKQPYTDFRDGSEKPLHPMG